MGRDEELYKLLRSPAKVSDTGTSPRNKGAAAHSQKANRGGRGRREGWGGGSSPLFSSPSPRDLPRSRRGSSWAGLRFPGPAAFSSLPPAGAAPVLAGSSRPPHRGGVCVPPQRSPQPPRLPSPQLRAPPRRLGEGMRAGRAQGSPPPGLTVPTPPTPLSLCRTERAPSPLRPGKVGGRARLRAGRGLGRASPRPRRRGRAEAARAARAGHGAEGLLRPVSGLGP